jgi:hypothetical protein
MCGKLVSPSSPQPPLQLADLSALCVRAELDERDLGSIKVKQPIGTGCGVSRAVKALSTSARIRHYCTLATPNGSGRAQRNFKHS